MTPHDLLVLLLRRRWAPSLHHPMLLQSHYPGQLPQRTAAWRASSAPIPQPSRRLRLQWGRLAASPLLRSLPPLLQAPPAELRQALPAQSAQVHRQLAAMSIERPPRASAAAPVLLAAQSRSQGKT